MNRRVSDASTRGTDGVSIRAVNFGRAPQAAVPAVPALSAIPGDVVFIASTYAADNTSCDPSLATDRCLQPVADHAPGGTASYTDSALVPGASAPVVFVDQKSSTAPSNSVVIDGMILAPNATVVFDGGANPDHALRVSGGLVADSIVLGHQSPSANYTVGVVDQAIQQRFELVVDLVSTLGIRASSHAVLDVNADGNYAINAWSVDTAS